MGPGIGFYGIDAKLNTSLSPEDENAFFEALNSILSEKIPGYDRVIGSGELKGSGSSQNNRCRFSVYGDAWVQVLTGTLKLLSNFKEIVEIILNKITK